MNNTEIGPAYTDSKRAWCLLFKIAQSCLSVLLMSFRLITFAVIFSPTFQRIFKTPDFSFDFFFDPLAVFAKRLEFKCSHQGKK